MTTAVNPRSPKPASLADPGVLKEPGVSFFTIPIHTVGQTQTAPNRGPKVTALAEMRLDMVAVSTPIGEMIESWWVRSFFRRDPGKTPRIFEQGNLFVL